jgi:hypothetical protein
MKLRRFVCRTVGFTLLAFGGVNFANAGTPGLCAGHIPQCKVSRMCGSKSTTCNVRISEKHGVATATAQNLANGHSGKPAYPICVEPGTKISWSTQESGSGFIATFGVPHPFTRTPTTGAIFQGNVGQPDSDIADLKGCYQYDLQHSIDGQPSTYADPKVIVTSPILGGNTH